MAIILNIESSGPDCSVALTSEGELLADHLDTKGMNHSTVMAPYIESCLSDLKRRGEKLDAVAVSLGPGSYTGLRIGLSMAKGLAFGMNIPLIGIPTLEILAVKAMFRSFDIEGDEILLPMLDARRMEVYAAAYDLALKTIVPMRPEILTESSFAELEGRKVTYFGSGSDKAVPLFEPRGWRHFEGLAPHAADMMALSERAFRNGDFIDVAYSEPIYLKEYQAGTPKQKI